MVEANVATEIVAAVFHAQTSAINAMIAVESRVTARLEIGLTSLRGAGPHDPRTVLAIRVSDGPIDAIVMIVQEFGGTVIARGGRDRA
jgi:hypothetical protein